MEETMIAETWSYSEAVEQERRSRLLSFGSFVDVYSAMMKSRVDIVCEDDIGEDDFLRNSARPIFTMIFSDDIADVFHNGPAGYRGQFWHSEKQGCRANRDMIDALRQDLLDAYRNTRKLRGSDFEMDFIGLSLSARSAKVWTATEPTDKEIHLHPELIAPRWINKALVPEPILGTEDYYLWRRARFGTRMPVPKGIKVFGGFLDLETEKEKVHPSKVDRARQIHNFGFS
ncbi:MAG: hypothetical protein AB7P12_08115 [Alphaproteobacteria bacterium]